MNNFKITVDGQVYSVAVEEQEGGKALVEVNGKKVTVAYEKEAAVKAAPVARPVAAAGAGVSGKISSPLPGNITKVMVNAGQKVKRGEVMLTMEAMKMENNVMAECDGTVTEVYVAVGQSVMQGDALVYVEADAVAAAPAPKPVAKPAAAPAAAPVAPAPAATKAGLNTTTAPLPGSITKILVSEGQNVKRGDVVLTMEAMKMENNIMAERDGVVSKIHVAVAQGVMQGDALFDIN